MMLTSTGTSTGKILDSLPRKGAVTELFSSELNVLYYVKVQPTKTLSTVNSKINNTMDTILICFI